MSPELELESRETIMESWNLGGWDVKDHPTPAMDTVPLSQADPTWPWALPGSQGQPQLDPAAGMSTDLSLAWPHAHLSLLEPPGKSSRERGKWERREKSQGMMQELIKPQRKLQPPNKHNKQEVVKNNKKGNKF